MNLARWSPRREMFSANNQMDRVFNNFFNPVLNSANSEFRDWNPKVDIYEEKDTIVVKADLPGIDKKDITIDVKGRTLTLKGERKVDNEIKEESYHRKESAYGKFERAFTLPGEVDPNKIKADYKDGILKITIPNPEKEKAKQITIH
jgi:HSP20 family protein